MTLKTLLAVILASVIFLAGTGAAAAKGNRSAPLSKYLAGNVQPAFSAGKPGKITFVDQGALPIPIPEQGYSVPVALRNNTKYPIGNISAAGTIRSPSGKVVGSGTDQGFDPSRVLAGEVSLGFIYLQPGTNVPAGSTMKVTGSESIERTTKTYDVDLLLEGVNNTGQQIVGLVKNPRTHAVQGPGSVVAFCVSSSGQFMGQPTSGTANFSPAPLGAGATSSFTLPLYGQSCPTYLVGAWAFDMKYV
jgi:hypothetical protein